MITSSFNPVLMVTMKNWKLLMFTGILSVASGVYISFISSEIFSELTILLGFTFILACLSGVVFSLQLKSEDIWIAYLIYAGLLFVFGVFMMIYYNIDILLFILGSLSLFRYVQLLGTVQELRKFDNIRWGIISILCILGGLFSFVLILSPVFNISISESILTALSFILLGGSSMALAGELRKINNFHNNIRRLIKDLKEKDILYNKY